MPQQPASRSTTVPIPECARAARASAPAAPSPSDDSGRAAGRSRGRLADRAEARPACHSCSRYSSNRTHASPTTRALRCVSPRSRAGASSRTAERQLGSRNTIALAARGDRRRAPRRSPPRSGARCRQQALRNQRPAAAAMRREPAPPRRLPRARRRRRRRSPGWL